MRGGRRAARQCPQGRALWGRPGAGGGLPPERPFVNAAAHRGPSLSRAHGGTRHADSGTKARAGRGPAVAPGVRSGRRRGPGTDSSSAGCRGAAARAAGWGGRPGAPPARLPACPRPRPRPRSPVPAPRRPGPARAAALTELHQQVLVGRQRLLEVALVEHQDVVLLLRGGGARARQGGQGQAEQSAAQHVGSGRGASVGAAGTARPRERAPAAPPL